MHLRTIEAIAEIAVTGLIVIRMILVGFLQRPGRVLSWPMYSQGSYAVVELTVDSGDGPMPVNPYELRPLSSSSLSTTDVQNLVDFLGRDGAQVGLHGYVLWRNGRSELTLIDGRVHV